MRPLVLLAALVPAIAQTPCQQLPSHRLPNATITAAQPLATHCRVALTLTPSPDSEIKVEVWLPPAPSWNGKLLSAGGGGFVGSINTAALTNAIKDGYAAASTDTGHTGGNGAFALNHPEKVIDFAYRAVHEMTVNAKAVITAHYGRPARLAYFQGCSTGGRQGLMSAQRYPADYDGIIAGAPANNQIQLCAWRMALSAAVLQDPAKALSPAHTTLLNNAVLKTCDSLDGVADGLIEDPRRCRFDPASLLCPGPLAESCLTQPQVDTVRMAYADATKQNGELIYPGLLPGGETGWLLPGNSKEPGIIDLDMFRYIAHQDPNWDWRSYQIEPDLALAQKNAGFIEANDPDLSKFKARGGKLLIYHGWNDGGSGGAISPQNTLNYYAQILKTMGPNQQNWFRLFMVPGMAHCGGGPGPNQFNPLAALERWREQNIPPASIPAARVANNRVDMTRPLCPFPQAATYNGSGTTSDAANFSCRLP